jgi:cytochrome c oxidase subunit II
MGAFLIAALLIASPPESTPERVIVVTAKKFDFTPAAIELKVGVPVVLELHSADRKHGFTVPDLKVDAAIDAGGVTRVRIVPDRAGTFEFHCNVFCGSGHEEMSGQIVVTP